MNTSQIQPKTKTKSKTERFEARLTFQQKELLQRAADLQGRSISDFIISVAQKEAKKVIRDQEVLTLSPEASRKFVELLLNPPKPNKALRDAYADYKKHVIEK